MHPRAANLRQMPPEVERRALKRNPLLRGRLLRKFVVDTLARVDALTANELRVRFEQRYRLGVKPGQMWNALWALEADKAIVRCGARRFVHPVRAECPFVILRARHPLAAKIMAVLAEEEYPLRIHRLASKTNRPPQALYTPLRELRKMGWAVSEERNGRVVWRATLAGQQAYKDAQLLDLFT